MKIIIEDAETLKFLAAEGCWTTKPVESLSFPSTRVASAAARREAIGRFNIVGFFADTAQFINMDHGRGKGGEAAPAVT